MDSIVLLKLVSQVVETDMELEVIQIIIMQNLLESELQQLDSMQLQKWV